MSSVRAPQLASRGRASSGADDGSSRLPLSGNERCEAGPRAGDRDAEGEVRSDNAYWQRIVDRATD